MNLPRLAWRGTRVVTRTALRIGTAGTRVAAGAVVRRVVKLPEVQRLPEGRIIDLPGRGSTFVVDVAGPSPDAPAVVLLHGLSCTAYLGWFTVLAELSRTHRVIALDQRWHGRGIMSPRFRFDDCAGDVVALLDELGIEETMVVGYSMGGAVAQILAHRHPERVSGLVLCSTARNFRGHLRERLFFPMMTLTMNPLSRFVQPRVERMAQALPEMPSVHTDDLRSWGTAEFRSTSAWSMPEVLGELGRFNSKPWVGEIDTPTAVVVTAKDRAIPSRRQRRLAAAIPDAVVFEAPGGHASVVMDHEGWTPVFIAAVADVTGRLPVRRRVAV